MISAQVAPVADRIFEVYEDEFREFQREHEARAQAGAQAGDAAGDEDEDGVDLAAVGAAADAAIAAETDDAAVAAIRSAFNDVDEQRAAAAAAIDELAGRGALGAGIEHTIGSIYRVDALAEAFDVEDVPDLSAERERLLAEAARFGEMVRNNPAMLARFRAARAVDAATDDEAVAIIRNVTPPEEDAMRLAARAAIDLLRARGLNGIPLREDNARIDRLVAEFDVPPPQI